MYTISSILIICLMFVSSNGQYYGSGHGILPFGYSPSGAYQSRMHFPSTMNIYGGSGSRLGLGYLGNPGIGIKQTGATLANLYGLPQSLAAAPAPRPLSSPYAINPYYGQALNGYGAYGPALMGNAYGGYLGK
ncbi:hypothetical protein RDWZM_010432 [Blomia tropicalis]|uniref:Uncharacterized protein n=1 Tax=Blomia tropicalis TaxID=40697 RepID=A0A9Q0LZ67_BLOTA|nr:hypothetical protein RDWZM_010432 [Blomia tropicalis]